MADIKECIVWTQPGCSLSQRVVKLMEEHGCEVEERKVDGANWTWSQFKAASPDWSNLPTIQLPTGHIIRNHKELEDIFGRPDSLYNPPVKPWAPR